MLNLGHNAVAAVFTIWNIRHNVIGVPGADGKLEKDFIRPVTLTSLLAAVEALPKAMRNEVEFLVEQVSTRLKATEGLQAASAIAHAVRISASEELRALITYNSDEDDWPESRYVVR
jgi:fumarate hydratase class II